MQAWKLTYSNAKDPSQRFITGICGNSREDAINAIKRFAKWPYNVERAEYLGEIHALSETAEKRIVDYYARMNPRPTQSAHQKQAEAAIPSDVTTPTEVTPEIYSSTEDDGEKVDPDKTVEEEEENVSASNEIECQYCGRVCKGASALTLHEKRCDQNPNVAKKSGKKA